MRVFIFILLFISLSYSKVLNISNIENYEPTNYISYLEDNNYKYEDIMNKKDINLLEKKNLKTFNQIFWTKLTIKNDSNNFKELVIYNNLAGINEIDVYLIKNDKLDKVLLLGDFREQNLRELNNRYSSFILKFEPNEEITIVTKLDNYLVNNLSWEITTIENFTNQEFKIIFIFGLFGGILILFLIFNFLNYFIYKKIEYLIICGITLSIFSYQYSFNGILYFLNLDMNLQFITAIAWDATTVGGLFIALFSITFFQLYRNYKKFFWSSLFFVFTCLAILLYLIYTQFIDNDLYRHYYLVLVNLIILILYLNILAFYMFFKKEQGSLYYLIGNIILFMAVGINGLAIMGVINYYEELKYIGPLSYVIDICLMLISISVKINFEQKELRKAKILLLEQSNFSSLGQAIGHISHQWKNPLSKLGTLITLLEAVSEHKLEELNCTFKKKLPLMKNSIDMMKKSIDEFSNYYTVKKEMEDFFIVPCIKNILEILDSKMILKKVNVYLDIPLDLKIKSFEHIWSNIFLVLVDNSLDAFTLDDEFDKKIHISCEKHNDKTILTYIDNAGGIKIKPIESVFDYFVSGKEKAAGTGFGLAVIKMLINDRLNGKIDIENFENGVKFTIVI